jgi:hypothetical protein
MKDGVAVVAYDCHSLRLLKGCRIDSGYGFMAFSRKEETIRFENADEVAANLPAFGIPLLKGLRGDLTANSTLDLATVLVGKMRTTVSEAARGRLLGGEACEGATHFVRGAFVGAFALGTGTRGEASLGAGLFSAGSTSSRLANYRDGDPSSCQQVTRSTETAPASCDALLRLELVALAASKARTPPEPQETQATATADEAAPEEEVCPTGLVLVEGKCSQPTQDRPHQCKYGDLADCTTQCGRNEPRSCDVLGGMFAFGKGVAKSLETAVTLFKKACSGGVPRACRYLGTAYERGVGGLAQDAERAVALYKHACDDGGYAPACMDLGIYYEHVTKEPARAAPIFRQACDGGYAPACLNLGFLYSHGKGVQTDIVRAVGLYKRTCDGGIELACSNMGERFAEGSVVAKDEAKAVALFKEACDAGVDLGCYNMGFMYEKGIGAQPDRAKAIGLYRQGCSVGNTWNCDRLKGMGASK